MNERIRELASQAEEYASKRDMTGEYVIAFDQDKYSKKFAELLIREYEQFLPEFCPWAKADEEGPMKGWHVQFVARKHFGME